MRYWIIAFLISFVGVTGCGTGEQPAPASSDVSHAGDAPDQPAGPAAAPAQPAPAGDDSGLELELISLEVPAGWTRNTAGSTFVLAEYTLPGDQADADAGRLTISVAGGGVDANVDRWRGQFVGELEAEAKSNLEVNGLPVTMVDFAGKFNDRRGPFAPEALRDNYRMLAAIISVDGQLHFIKATGPKATIAGHLDAFQEFVKSVKRR